MAHLPLSRTKTIMKTTDGADSISKEAVVLTTRAAELIIKEIAQHAVQNMSKIGEKKLNYINLVNVVHANSRYEFLEYMVPKKITVREYKEMMRKKDAKGSGSSDSSDDGDSTSSTDSSASEESNET